MRKILMLFLALALMAGMAQAATPVFYGGGSADPGADTSSDNDENNALWDALGGGWDHINGSDEWDGSGIGVGIAGGASALMEGTTDFLRIQDTGDPGDYPPNPPDPRNRKVWFGHQIDFGLDGAHLEFCGRVATDQPLDMQHPDGGGGIAPWPASGIGYMVRDDGKGMFGIAEATGGTLGFSLALQSELANYNGYGGIQTDALLLNELNTGVPSDAVTGSTGVPSYVPIDDATAWNTIVVDIANLNPTDYRLTISVNGNPAVTRDVTVGDGIEYPVNVIHMGSSGTGALTAYDIDFYSAVPEPMTLSLLGLGGLALLRRRR
jgi:hypothetical protein